MMADIRYRICNRTRGDETEIVLVRVGFATEKDGVLIAKIPDVDVAKFEGAVEADLFNAYLQDLKEKADIR